MCLLVVDANSIWLEVKIVQLANSINTVKELRSIFAAHGLPLVVLSDNGRTFTSSEFRIFMKQNEIKHITSAPYRLASNGLVEMSVQTS